MWKRKKDLRMAEARGCTKDRNERSRESRTKWTQWRNCWWTGCVLYLFLARRPATRDWKQQQKRELNGIAVIVKTRKFSAHHLSKRNSGKKNASLPKDRLCAKEHWFIAALHLKTGPQKGQVKQRLVLRLPLSFPLPSPFLMRLSLVPSLHTLRRRKFSSEDVNVPSLFSIT